MFTWALSASGVQILTLEVLVFVMQEAEVTEVKHKGRSKLEQSYQLPDRSPAGRWRVYFPSVSNTGTTVTVLDAVVVNVEAGWIITPSVNMATALPTKLLQAYADGCRCLSHTTWRSSQDMFHG